ncbi:DUF3471 domain-containing protein [candidate division KSB1 bacterium]
MNRKRSFIIVKALIFFTAVLFITPCCIFSQEKAVKIDGVWEGTLDAMGTQLRIVVNISLKEDGSYKATMDSPDQGATGLAVDEVTFKDGKLNFVMNMVGGDYKGILKEDGLTFDGEWSQAGTSFPLVLKKDPSKKAKEIKERVAVKIDPVVLDDYVGKYEIAPQVMIFITKQKDKLFSQVSGQQSVEIFPESETEFFLKIADIQITFVKDEAGKVTHLILHRAGRDTKAEKKEN